MSGHRQIYAGYGGQRLDEDPASLRILQEFRSYKPYLFELRERLLRLSQTENVREDLEEVLQYCSDSNNILIDREYGPDGLRRIIERIQEMMSRYPPLERTNSQDNGDCEEPPPLINAPSTSATTSSMRLDQSTNDFDEWESARSGVSSQVNPAMGQRNQDFDREENDAIRGFGRGAGRGRGYTRHEERGRGRGILPTQNEWLDVSPSNVRAKTPPWMVDQPSTSRAWEDYERKRTTELTTSTSTSKPKNSNDRTVTTSNMGKPGRPPEKSPPPSSTSHFTSQSRQISVPVEENMENDDLEVLFEGVMGQPTDLQKEMRNRNAESQPLSRRRPSQPHRDRGCSDKTKAVDHGKCHNGKTDSNSQTNRITSQSDKTTPPRGQEVRRTKYVGDYQEKSMPNPVNRNQDYQPLHSEQFREKYYFPQSSQSQIMENYSTDGPSHDHKDSDFDYDSIEVIDHAKINSRDQFVASNSQRNQSTSHSDMSRAIVNPTSVQEVRRTKSVDDRRGISMSIPLNRSQAHHSSPSERCRKKDDFPHTTQSQIMRGNSNINQAPHVSASSSSVRVIGGDASASTSSTSLRKRSVSVGTKISANASRTKIPTSKPRNNSQTDAPTPYNQPISEPNAGLIDSRMQSSQDNCNTKRPRMEGNLTIPYRHLGPPTTPTSQPRQVSHVNSSPLASTSAKDQHRVGNMNMQNNYQDSTKIKHDNLIYGQNYQKPERRNSTHSGEAHVPPNRHNMESSNQGPRDPRLRKGVQIYASPLSPKTPGISPSSIMSPASYGIIRTPSTPHTSTNQPPQPQPAVQNSTSQALTLEEIRQITAEKAKGCFGGRGNHFNRGRGGVTSASQASSSQTTDYNRGGRPIHHKNGQRRSSYNPGSEAHPNHSHRSVHFNENSNNNRGSRYSANRGESSQRTRTTHRESNRGHVAETIARVRDRINSESDTSRQPSVIQQMRQELARGRGRGGRSGGRGRGY